MKKIISIFLTLILSSLILVGQTSDLKDFEEFLGNKKTSALNELNKSFEDFLKTNFPEIEDENTRIYKFLEGFKDWSNLKKDWIIDYDKAIQTLDQFENSGLRIEHWIYGYETYKPTYLIESSFLPQDDTSSLDTLSLGDIKIEEEIIPITNGDYDPELEEKLQRQRDSSQSLNLNGQFLYGLLRFGQNDSLIKGYTEAVYATGDISTSLKAGGLTVENLDLSSPLRKRLIIMDFYYHFLKWNIENKETTR